MVSTRLEFPCLCVFGSRQSDPTGGKDAKLTWILVGMAGAATLCGVAGLIFLQTANGMSARAKPSTLEAWVARRARALAMSSEAKSLKSPVTKTPEVLAEGLAHWADHCASCHANDGSGETPMGKGMYPPAPDMRDRGTQELSDGELFYVIENGVRLPGMPVPATMEWTPGNSSTSYATCQNSRLKKGERWRDSIRKVRTKLKNRSSKKNF